MTTHKSSAYLIQNPETKEFFSSLNSYHGIIEIPVLFGAWETAHEEDAWVKKNSIPALENYNVVKRTSTIELEIIK